MQDDRENNQQKPVGGSAGEPAWIGFFTEARRLAGLDRQRRQDEPTDTDVQEQDTDGDDPNQQGQEQE